MPDNWSCSLCKINLRCSCNSMECSFDYDIQEHVIQDVRHALAFWVRYSSVPPEHHAGYVKHIMGKLLREEI